MYSEDDLLALSGLQHLAYCERQWALIHLEQEWCASSDTVAGDLFHERANTPGYSTRNGVVSMRGVHLYSRELGLYGVADIVEREPDEPGALHVVPVEYKVGRPKVEDWDRVQVAAQSICLEEMWGVHIEKAALFYGKTHQREYILVDEAIRQRVTGLALRMHELYARCITPKPDESSRCKRCSLRDVCLPFPGNCSVVQYWKSMGEEVE